MKSRVVVFTLLIAGSAFAAEGWWSPDKAYSIVPPVDWSQSTSKGEQNSSYAFTSPDHKAEIRVSAAYHISLPENMPDDVLEMAFLKERGITPIARIYGTASDGLRREYADRREPVGPASLHATALPLFCSQ